MGRIALSAVGCICILFGIAAPASAGWPSPRALRYVYAFVALQDIVHTTACASRQQCHEANVTLAPIAEQWGIESAMLVKGAEHGAVVLGLQHLEKKDRKVTQAITWMLIGAQVGVNVYNYKQLQKVGLK